MRTTPTTPLRAVPDRRRPQEAGRPGQAFADMVLLAALSCQAPVAVLAVPKADGSWSTLAHGLAPKSDLDDPALYEHIAASSEPVEVPDLPAIGAHEAVSGAPHFLRWAYGVALRDESEEVIAVLAVLDRSFRRVSKRDHRALAAIARQLLTTFASTSGARAASPAAGDGAEIAPIRPISRRAAPMDLHPAGSLFRRSAAPGSPFLLDGPKLLRTHEVAAIFHVTERTVVKWARTGKLKSLRTIGGQLRFPRDGVAEMLAASQTSKSGARR